VCLDDHGEVGVICLRYILLVFAQLDCHDVAQVGTRVIPVNMTKLKNNILTECSYSSTGTS
jgi:hypothetical protein